MSAPLLIDLCCSAGGATRGYQLAGFEVWGVDVRPQPRYPGSRFIRADALDVLAEIGCGRLPWPAAVHASPPCQTWSAYRRRGSGVGAGYPDLIGDLRMMLGLLGIPYVIENVPGAPLLGPIRLCGSSFGLDVRRHRLFETSWPTTAPACDHGWQTPRFPQATNRTNPRSTVEVGVRRIPLAVQQQAMQIDWMTREELSQAVPPAFTRYLGVRLMEHLAAGRAA